MIPEDRWYVHCLGEGWDPGWHVLKSTWALPENPMTADISSSLFMINETEFDSKTKFNISIIIWDKVIYLKYW